MNCERCNKKLTKDDECGGELIFCVDCRELKKKIMIPKMKEAAEYLKLGMKEQAIKSLEDVVGKTVPITDELLDLIVEMPEVFPNL